MGGILYILEEDASHNISLVLVISHLSDTYMLSHLK